MKKLTIWILLATLCAGCEQAKTVIQQIERPMPAETKKATFGAGCFWGVEKFFSKIDGVVDTTVGYMGGRTENPTYEDICNTDTGHAEVVQVTYDPSKVSYRKLLETFWEWHDPTTRDQQGPDIGSQYRSVIFFHDEAQQAAALKSKQLLEQVRVFRAPIVTQIVPAGTYYLAEDYHQDYLVKNPLGYCSHERRSESGKIRAVLKELPD